MSVFRPIAGVVRIHSPNVRHPRCILYNSKQLAMLTLNVEHNYICFYYKEFTTTCFGPICGPSSC